MVAWAIWGSKNKFVVEKVEENFGHTIQWTLSFYQQFKETKTNIDFIEQQTERSRCTWIAPPPTSYKLNVDAAYSPDLTTCCLGVIIRDDKGQVMAAGALPRRSALVVLEAEMLAIREGFSLLPIWVFKS